MQPSMEMRFLNQQSSGSIRASLTASEESQMDIKHLH